MAELAINSQSALLLPQFQSRINTVKGSRCIISIRGSTVSSRHNLLSISRVKSVLKISLPAFSCQAQQNHHFKIAAVSDSTVSNLYTTPGTSEVDIKLDTSGGGGFGDGGSGGGGGGGNGGDGNGDRWEEEGEGPDESDGKKAKALSMSQKLTLAYAALVGLGGLMGFLKSGSQSL